MLWCFRCYYCACVLLCLSAAIGGRLSHLHDWFLSVRRCLNLKIPTKPPPHPPKRYPQDGHTGYLPHVHSKRRPNDIIDVSSKKSKYETGSLFSVHPSGVGRGGDKHSLGVTLLLYWPVSGCFHYQILLYNCVYFILVTPSTYSTSLYSVYVLYTGGTSQ